MRLYTVSRALRSYDRCILSLVSQHLGCAPSCSVRWRFDSYVWEDFMIRNMRSNIFAYHSDSLF